jgi:hypothetical protein
MDIVLLTGVVGSGLVLLAFFMLEFGRWSKESVWYDILNAVGAVMLIWYSYLLDSIPFILLNLAWLLVSVKDLLRR